MPYTSIKKKIPCSKENLIKMVLDIEKYPEYVPWCLNGKIHNKIDKGNIIEIIAALTIGKSFFYETYKSSVIYDKSADSIYVTNMGGALKYLKNKWFFRRIGNNSEVDFHIDFELKNKVFNVLISKSFDIGLKKVANAFEKRAIELFKSSQN